MGNQKSEFEQQFSKNYNFIQAIQDSIYGLVKVYRKKYQNYHYVMVIDRRLQQFNNHTFMNSCITPSPTQNLLLMKGRNSDNSPKMIIQDKNFTQYDSQKLQKLKRTLQLIKRFQNQLTVSLYSYQIINGNKLKCTQPLIQLYVQYQNHRLYQYLDVLRTKQLPLKLGQIVYILRAVCLAIIQIQKMEIQVTYNQINIKTILTSNEGQAKINPIQILTKKQHELLDLKNIQIIKSQYQTNPSIECRKVLSQNKSSGAYDKKSSQGTSISQKNQRQRQVLFSSSQNSIPRGHYSSKLDNHKQILQKLLIQLSAYNTKDKPKKYLKELNQIIKKSNSLAQIDQQLMRYDQTSLQGLIVERIYDLPQEKVGDIGLYVHNYEASKASTDLQVNNKQSAVYNQISLTNNNFGKNSHMTSNQMNFIGPKGLSNSNQQLILSQEPLFQQKISKTDKSFNKSYSTVISNKTSQNKIQIPRNNTGTVYYQDNRSRINSSDLSQNNLVRNYSYYMGQVGANNQKDKLIRSGLNQQKLALSSYANTAANQLQSIQMNRNRHASFKLSGDDGLNNQKNSKITYQQINQNGKSNNQKSQKIY